MHEIYKNFNSILNELKEKKIKQIDVANKLGVTQTALSAWKHNRRNIPKSIQVSICREFNVNPEYLSSGTGEMFINPHFKMSEFADYEMTPQLLKWLSMLDEQDVDNIISLMNKLKISLKN